MWDLIARSPEASVAFILGMLALISGILRRPERLQPFRWAVLFTGLLLAVGGVSCWCWLPAAAACDE